MIQKLESAFKEVWREASRVRQKGSVPFDPGNFDIDLFVRLETISSVNSLGRRREILSYVERANDLLHDLPEMRGLRHSNKLLIEYITKDRLDKMLGWDQVGSKTVLTPRHIREGTSYVLFTGL